MIAVPFDLECVRARLPGRRIEWYSAVDSTMTVAAQFARRRCFRNDCRGRCAERRHRTAGALMAFGTRRGSIHFALYSLRRRPLLQDAINAQSSLPLAMLALGFAAQETITEVSGLAPDLRWPNDVLLGGKKCAGIFAQMECDAIIAGIGINVGHSEFPAEIREIATSLAMERARVRRENLLVALARVIDEHMDLMETKGAAAILDIFTRSSSYVSGRRVKVDQPGGDDRRHYVRLGSFRFSARPSG